MTTPIITQLPREKHRREPWEEKPTAAGQAGKAALLSFVVLAVLFPMWVIVVTSMSSRAAINDAGGLVVVPQELDLSAYVAIFSGGRVTRALAVSTFLATFGTALSVVLTILAAYGLSRRGSFGHRSLLFVFLLTFFVYPGLIPSYLVVTGLGLKDNLLALILPTAGSRWSGAGPGRGAGPSCSTTPPARSGCPAPATSWSSGPGWTGSWSCPRAGSRCSGPTTRRDS